MTSTPESSTHEPPTAHEHDNLPDGLRALFEREGLMRFAVQGDAEGNVEVWERGPLVALGPGDTDFIAPPVPETTGYPGKPSAEMTLDEYNAFLFVWLERAVAAGLVRCAQCGKPLLAGDDLADADTWDAIMIEKELVAWMAVHFDCKRKIAKKLKGMNPFELAVAASPALDLSDATVPEVPPPAEVADADDGTDEEDETYGRE